jgi:hypothetical protein
MTWNLNVFRMCPSIESAGWRFASLHKVLRGEFPCFNGTFKALRLPAVHPAALRCLRLAVPQRSLVPFAPRRTSAPPRPGVGHPVAPAGMSLRRRQDLPKFLGDPNCPFAHVPYRRRQDRRHQTEYSAAAWPWVIERPRLPRVGLSTLNSMAFGLVVYASQCKLPRPTQDSLPAAGQALPDGLFTRKVPIEGFRVSSHPPPPSLLGAIDEACARCKMPRTCGGDSNRSAK